MISRPLALVALVAFGSSVCAQVTRSPQTVSLNTTESVNLGTREIGTNSPGETPRAGETARWKLGINYDLVVPPQPTNVSAGKVEVLEVFWFGCPHCYALEPYIQRWMKSKPDYIQFVSIPAIWKPSQRAHARLFYTLEALGRSDLRQKVFETLHHDRAALYDDNEAASLDKQLAWARENGIDERAFRKAYTSEAVSSSLDRSEDTMRRYHVVSVPSVFVNGKYGTDVLKAGGQDNLLSLVNDLAASERPR